MKHLKKRAKCKKKSNNLSVDTALNINKLNNFPAP